MCVSALCFDKAGDLFKPLFASTGWNDNRSCIGKYMCEPPPKAGSASGDERNLARQIVGIVWEWIIGHFDILADTVTNSRVGRTQRSNLRICKRSSFVRSSQCFGGDDFASVHRTRANEPDTVTRRATPPGY